MDDKKWLRQVPLQAIDVSAPVSTPRVVEHLDDAAAMELLAGVPYGRIVFMRDGEPEIRPLRHLIDDGQVIVRTRLNAALSEAVAHADGLKAAFEADWLDVERSSGWSVIISGTAASVADPQRQAHYKELLQTMLAGPDDSVIAIRPETVSGIRVIPVSETATEARRRLDTYAGRG